MQLRIGTYNIAGGKSARDLVADGARLQRLLARIHELSCDLLGLQEVRSNPGSIEPNAAVVIARAEATRVLLTNRPNAIRTAKLSRANSFASPRQNSRPSRLS